jgi:hypothetical protein
MKLTQQHIENLYKFTRQHYVVHYDLQTELVDHLANDIETIWETKPNLSFEQARDISFKKFGVFGFMDVVSARQKAMSKRYMKLLWSFAKVWFTLPKLLQTLVLFLTALFLFNLSYGKIIAISLFSGLFISMFIKGIKFSKYIKKKEKTGEKLWLLEDLIFRNATATGMLLLSMLANSYNTLRIFWNYENSQLIVAIIFTLISLYVYISVVVMPKNAENVLKSTYPEFNM